ncbi:PEBP-like protein [Stereum hirsutum FP-91666 SS1]|uniref:PEBP-like protein n=1 Tax=Stereum hirsutum (strain FP-91666) TaxID=721885 RepID=UPI000440D4D9|nr:PEBP-like protein [Stereum hirsutum FP-91666 SS1]EIM87952.1 PEBP-like protein [Stereum hirsutum FP-91666 SS1]
MWYTILPVVACLALAKAQTSDTISSVAAAFTNFSIVPDVLSSFAPIGLLDVVFTDPATGETLHVTPGTNLTMEQTLNEPQFFFTTNDTSLSNSTFVIVLVDPDAPTPQNTSISQFRHMLAGDFMLSNMGNTINESALTNTSAAVTPFVNPTPPAGSDPHRYVVLLFEQPFNFDTEAPMLITPDTPRNNFNLTIFNETLNLGPPLAGNFFLTGPDNSTTTASATTGSAASLSTSFGNPSGSGSVVSVTGGAASSVTNAASTPTNTATSGAIETIGWRKDWKNVVLVMGGVWMGVWVLQ